MSHIVTIFKNIKETDTPFFREVDTIIERIKKGASKDLVKKIRKEQDKGIRNSLKKALPSICTHSVENVDFELIKDIS